MSPHLREIDDGLHYDAPQVIVHVLGANLYSPVFSQRFYLAEVQENAPPGSKVIQVSLSFHSRDLIRMCRIRTNP